MFDFSLARQSLLFVARHRGAAFRLIWPLLLLWLAWDMVKTATELNPSLAVGHWSVVVAFSLASLGLVAIVGTAWHRYVLLAERPWSRGVVPGWREGRYFLSFFLLSLISLLWLASVAVAAVFMPGTASPAMRFGIGAVAIIVETFFFSRLAFTLPAIAVDASSYGLRESWQRSRPYARALFSLALVLCGLNQCADLVLWAVSALIASSPYLRDLVGFALTLPFTFAAEGMLFTAISFVYYDAVKTLDSGTPRS